MRVKTDGMQQVANAFSQMQGQLDNSVSQLGRFSSRYGDITAVAARLGEVQSVWQQLELQADQFGQCGQVLRNASDFYQETERKITDYCDEIGRQILQDRNSLGEQVPWYQEVQQRFLEEFGKNFGWKQVLSGAGYIGKIYNFINDIQSGKTWKDFAKDGVKAYEFLEGAAKTFRNYQKIGNAVGTQTAMAWWAKNITGLKTLGRASTAKNPVTRFANNLTNKTSPFHAQFENIINNFKGVNGVKKAVTSWGAVAINGVLNWASNKQEQAESNGTMSDGRVIAETVSETIIDTALTYGSSIVVGAAVTTVLGTVAAPGVLVVAASGAVTAGINAGVKAITGKTTTEWVSDTILDTGEAIGKAVGDMAKSVSESIGGWFGKLAFT